MTNTCTHSCISPRHHFLCGYIHPTVSHRARTEISEPVIILISSGTNGHCHVQLLRTLKGQLVQGKERKTCQWAQSGRVTAIMTCDHFLPLCHHHYQIDSNLLLGLKEAVGVKPTSEVIQMGKPHQLSHLCFCQRAKALFPLFLHSVNDFEMISSWGEWIVPVPGLSVKI